jgi:TctA family transporter
MELLGNLALGFGAAMTVNNLMFCLIGCLVGTLVGVLPGIGPIATIAMLLPLTFGLDPLTALIMLAGIYYGAQYGGSASAILLNLPGESSSVVTCLDGYRMAQQGRAGSALAIAALGSFFAGCVSTVFIAAFAPVLSVFSQQFRSPEYFALMLVGLVAAVVLAQGSMLRATAMVLLGLMFGLAGSDVTTGLPRFTFGIPDFYDGIDFVPVAMGLFGLAEIIANLERGTEQRGVISSRIGRLWPTREEFKASWPAILRGTGLGSLLGIVPGGGAVLSSFAAYTLEKRLASDPSRFGRGAIEGVAGPESANNAGAQTSFIPLLTLGIPSTPVMAVMMAAMVIQGISPGTAVLTERPILFWGMVASMWIGNLMLLIINLPLVGVWVRLLRVPYRVLFPCVLLFCCVGVYSLSGESAVIMTAGFAFLGYVFVKLGCEPAPFLLGFVLGPLMEQNLRRSMLLFNGDPTLFLQRPISVGLLVLTFFLLFIIVLPTFRSTRDVAFRE